MGIKKAFHAWNAESDGLFMDLDTDYIIKNIKKEYLAYMDSLEIPENEKKALFWNKDDKHINIYIIQLSKTSSFDPSENRYKSLIFATKSDEDNLEVLTLPEETEIPYLDQRTKNDICKYLIKHKLVDIDLDLDDTLFTITATVFAPDFINSDNVIRAFKQWSYHFLNTQISFIENSLFDDNLDENENTVEVLINKVNDKIFSYQYDEATDLLSLEYYLGAACVFGVALERICVLIAKKNNVEYPKDKTELGPFAYTLHKEHAINDSFKKRIIAASKFRNLSSHTNAEAVKGDALVLDTIIQDLVDEYL